MNINDFLKKEGQLIEDALEKYLPSENEYPDIIMKSMRYSVKNGGKRIRPILMRQAYNICGGTSDIILPFACAIEFIHCYSLIHDDLPALDNDDLRRGKPTNHKVFGEAIAILAGDALLTYAFEITSKTIDEFPEIKPNNIIKAINKLSRAAGIYGMIGGQVMDILSEGKEIDIPTLQYIHTHKTGALLAAPLEIGAILADSDEKTYNSLLKYGEYIGLAFQIVDDILDIIGDVKNLGKPIGSDEAKHKATYPAFHGLEQSKKDALLLSEKAKSEISWLGEKGKILSDLADFIVNRIY